MNTSTNFAFLIVTWSMDNQFGHLTSANISISLKVFNEEQQNLSISFTIQRKSCTRKPSDFKV